VITILTDLIENKVRKCAEDINNSGVCDVFFDLLTNFLTIFRKALITVNTFT